MSPRSAEREGEGLDAGVEELDLELPISDGLRLPDQLVHTGFDNGAVAGFVDVEAVRRSGWLSVEPHAELHRPVAAGPQDQMEVACVKAEHDAAVDFVEDRGFLADRPIAAQRPMIQSEVFGNGVDAMFVEAGAIDGRESFGASVADVGLGSLEAGPVGGLLEPVRLDGREVTRNSLLRRRRPAVPE